MCCCSKKLSSNQIYGIVVVLLSLIFALCSSSLSESGPRVQLYMMYTMRLFSSLVLVLIVGCLVKYLFMEQKKDSCAYDCDCEKCTCGKEDPTTDSSIECDKPNNKKTRKIKEIQNPSVENA